MFEFVFTAQGNFNPHFKNARVSSLGHSNRKAVRNRNETKLVNALVDVYENIEHDAAQLFV